MKRFFLQLLMLCLTVNFAYAQKLSLDKWEYIEVDNNRQKWGDWDKPDWLRYFGLDIKDINKDGYKDIISGRYFYLNPGGNMEGAWSRYDLGMNADGYLFVDIDGDEYADVIAEALPNIYWFEADNLQGSSWTCRKIGEIPKTDHVNGQGGRHAQIIAGGKEEIILAARGGIYAAKIPEQAHIQDNWKFNLIIKTGSSEGIGVGDIDGDGDLDLTAGDMPAGEKNNSSVVNWYENPGSIDKEWTRHLVGNVINAADRFEIADFDGDGKPDIAVAEEMWPGLKPDANLFVFSNPGNGGPGEWERKTIFTGYSINNLDAADIDNDGDVDLVTCEHKGKEFRLLLFENDGKGNFTMLSPDKGHESHLGTQLADLDSDGDLDIVSTAWDNYKFLHVWRNDNRIIANSANERIKWKHLSSASGDFLPPEVGYQAATLVLDIDKDGIDEIIIAGWGETSMVWYKKKGNSWERYLLDNTNSHIEAGGTYCDIDGDGDIDILQGGSWKTNEMWWWENPYPDFDPKKPWQKHTIKDTGAKQHHDQIFGDFDGDGKAELVFWNQQAGKLFIADIPKNPKDKNSWKFEGIWSWDGKLKYEGFAKGDINLDGKDDIVGGGFWFERKGKKYVARKIDDYGQSRSAVGDLIKGGIPEIVLGSGDGTGPLNMYQWKNNKWEKTVLIDKVVNGHSLQIIDVDGDGNLDIFTAEMVLWGNGSNPGSKTWILYGDGKGNFTKDLLNAATNIGNHESKLGDVDGDGRPDYVQKPFMKNVPRLDIWLNQGTNNQN